MTPLLVLQETFTMVVPAEEFFFVVVILLVIVAGVVLMRKEREGKQRHDVRDARLRVIP